MNTKHADATPPCPSALYVWLVRSEEVQEQPGSWRIRKWDTEPFPEANFTVSETFKPEPHDGPFVIRNADGSIGQIVQALPSATRLPVTQDGPLGGFATVGQEAAQLDFMLTQWQMEIEAAADDATSVEDAIHHDAEAMKLKREIIERFTPSATRLNEEQAIEKCEKYLHGTGQGSICGLKKRKRDGYVKSSP